MYSSEYESKFTSSYMMWSFEARDIGRDVATYIPAPAGVPREGTICEDH